MSVRALVIFVAMAISLSSANAAGLSVKLSSVAPIRLGDPVQINISYGGVPEGAGLVVSVVPDLPEFDYEKYGVYGRLLVLQPVPISGSGHHTVDWDTKNVGCDPVDAPMWCPSFQIGRYRIKAEAYDTSLFPLLGMVPRTTDPLSLAVSQSQAFEVVGEPDMAPLILGLDQAAIGYLAEAAGVGPGAVTKHVDTTSELQSRSGMLCKSYTAKRPFAGGVSACIPADVVGPFGVHRHRVMHEGKADLAPSIGPAPGVVPYDQALAKARGLADGPYQKIINAQEDARFSVRTQRGTDGIGRPAGDNVNSWIRRGWGYDLSAGVSGWEYRAQDDAWIFVIYEVQAGGSSATPDRFADQVMVRVEHDGRACVVRTVPYKGSFEIDDSTKACP